MRGPYDDIIDLPHPVSQKHPQMSMHDRAALCRTDWTWGRHCGNGAGDDQSRSNIVFAEEEPQH